MRRPCKNSSILMCFLQIFVPKDDFPVAGPEIPLSDEEWNYWSFPWRKTLVTKSLGKMISFKTLETNLQRKWARKNFIKLVDMADGYFLVYFSMEEDYNLALY